MIGVGGVCDGGGHCDCDGGGGGDGDGGDDDDDTDVFFFLSYSSDGTSKYATIRGCGDKLSILKERCVTLPNSLIQLNALSVFGDASGLTNAEACFCSSGDKCNNQERIYSTSGGTRISIPTGAFIGTVLYILVTIIR